LIDLIRGREILVVGMACSGLAAVRLLAELGARRIVVTDRKPEAELQPELALLRNFGVVKPVTGGNPPELVHPDLAMIIKSPGVPPTLELFRRAAELQIPVLSEIELAYAFIKAPLVGITGTNGKTTTTALTAAILEEAGVKPVMVAGNIGVPLCEAVGKIGASGVIVVELSSFQLENIEHFRPAAAVFLNFEADHLNYHGTVERYFQAKARIFENQKAGDYAILNAEDRAVASLSTSVPGELLFFGKSPLERGAGLEGDQLVLFNRGGKPQPVCPRTEIALPGEHNLENALAATTAAWALGADASAAGRILRRFRGIAHRLEPVATIKGVEFINDSKGTNPGATIKALRSFPGKAKILIAGGHDKGSDFQTLAAVIQAEVKHLVLLGETKQKLAAAVEKAGFKDYELVNSLEEAVAAAWSRAKAGDLVLLSPACASWDMFPDFEARGNLFKELVAALKKQHS